MFLWHWLQWNHGIGKLVLRTILSKLWGFVERIAAHRIIDWSCSYWIPSIPSRFRSSWESADWPWVASWVVPRSWPMWAAKPLKPLKPLNGNVGTVAAPCLVIDWMGNNVVKAPQIVNRFLSVWSYWENIYFGVLQSWQITTWGCVREGIPIDPEKHWFVDTPRRGPKSGAPVPNQGFVWGYLQ